MSCAATWTGASAATAVALYTFATVLGGILDPSYSHVSMHISELTSSHAPNRAMLAALYVGYNLALGGVGLGLLRSVQRSVPLLVAVASLLTSALVGVLLVAAYPQDSYGQAATTAGTVHIILAALAAGLSVVAVAVAARAFRMDAR